jgi:5'-methylthioadenosine/S-adenosylhomocysteine nucleosidase
MGKDISTHPGVQVVGLFAVYGEAKQLQKYITVESTTTAVQARFYQGTLNSKPIVLAEMGQGKVHAAAAAQYMVDHYNVTHLICWGTAGAIAPDLNVGDVIVAWRVVPHDGGWHKADGFTHLGVYNSAIPDGRHYRQAWEPATSLLATAESALTTAQWPTPPPDISMGTIVSGDQVIASAEKKEWLYTTFSALAVDMESGAVVQVAHLNNIPWLVVRAVSDHADATLDFDITGMITYDETPPSPAKELITAVSRVITNPGQQKALNELRRGLKLAANHAAVAVAAIVGDLPA